MNDLHKKGDENCNNKRELTLSNVYKLLARIIEKRINNQINEILEGTKCGFKRRGAFKILFLW